ncbi:MAG TPA: hypothetical protein VK817_23015 [Trebonia sp.]|nr:hypothetical protein [Trebonia sp.]
MLLAIVAAAPGRGEQEAHFAGFGGADCGVAGKCFPPVVPGLRRVAVGLVGAGEAAVRAGLLRLGAGLGRELKCGGVVRAGLARVTCLEGDVAEAVARFGLLSEVADFPEPG